MLTWKKKQSDSELRVTMKGQMTEQTPLAPLAEEIGAPSVVFDLAEVSRINSTGCREWLQMVRALAAKGVHIALERCSVAIVQQLSMIAGFEGNGEVRSVYAPYYCETCNREEERLLDLEAAADLSLSEPLVCPKCGGRMEFDDLPESYMELAGAVGRNA